MLRHDDHRGDEYAADPYRQGVCDPFMYHPAVIANFTASLRELTGGRAFIGLGAGAREAGRATRGPVSLKMQRETVNFLKSYTSGGDAELWGQTWHSEWIRNTPFNGQSIPVIMGPLGPRAMQLAGSSRTRF